MPGQAQASNTGPQAGRQVKVGADFQAKRLDTPLDKLTRKTAGKRSFTLTERKRGRYIRSRPMVGRPEDLAFDATFRTAAPFQRRRADERSRPQAGVRGQTAGLSEEGAGAPVRQPGALRGGRLMEHGCG